MINRILYFFLVSLLVVSSCKKDENITDPIPDISVNETINMALPTYQNLNNIGEWIFFTGGNRGLFIYHNLDDEFVAFDRNCTYQPADDCSTVSIDTIEVFLQCGALDSGNEWVPCCNSRFSFDGFPHSGPATIGLKQYRVSRSGSLLFVTN